MEYLVQDKSLTAIADAIRAKSSSTDKLTLAQMPEKITALQSSNTFVFQSTEMCNIAVNKLKSSSTFIFQSTEMCNITVNTYYKEES